MHHKKKILFIAPADSIHSHKWVEYFSENEFIWISYNKVNFDTHALLNQRQKNNLNKIKVNNFLSIPVIQIILSFFYFIKYQPTIVHIHSVYRYSFLSILIFLFHKNIILTVWGTDFLNHNKNFFKKKFFNFIFKKCRKITTDGFHIKDKIHNIFSFTKKKIELINFGMNDYFLDSKINFENIRNDVNKILQTKNNFFFSCRGYTSYYDYMTIIEAFYKLKKKNTILVLAGGTGEPYYKKLVRDKIVSLNLTSKVFILGHLNKDELKILYQKTEAFISASHHDAGISTSICEAMATGAKCIVANNSDNSFWIKDGVNGFLFENSNFEELYKQMTKIEKIDKQNLINFNFDILNKNNNYQNEMKKMERIYFE